MFPDEAVLPAGGSLGGGGGGVAPLAAGEAGQAPVTSGGAGAGGEAASRNGGAAGTLEPSAGAAGETGAGGAPVTTCEAPQQRVIPMTADTWIDAAKPSTTHANDGQLFVVGGAGERRVLLQLTLPQAAPGAWLINASLILTLESNADGSSAERRLGLHRLAHSFVENRATWLNFTNGLDGEWDTPGGDFGLLELASAVLPANTAQGLLTFDVTEPLRKVLTDQAVPLSLIVLEVGSVPPASAELAFTSRDGDAGPSLVIDLCPP